MNKIFSVIWNASMGGWVVASELVSKKTKKSGPSKGMKRAAVLAAGLSMGLMSTLSLAYGVNSTQIGQYYDTLGSDASGDTSVAIGFGSISSGARSAAIGPSAVASGASSFAAGDSAQAFGASTVAIGMAAGNNGQTTNTGNVAVGATAGQSVTGNHNTATGQGSGQRVTGDANTAIGAEAGADVTSSHNVAIGERSGTFVSGGDGNVAIGFSAGRSVIGGNNIAIGLLAGSYVTAYNTIALGNSATASQSGALALGQNARASSVNDVALGSGSSTAAAVGTASTVINGTTYNFAGTEPLSTVSIGSAGGDVIVPGAMVTLSSAGSVRTITNVAAGRISQTSTDAVNGSQLFATNTAVNGLGASISNIISNGAVKYFHANSTQADSQASGTDSVAIGPNARASGTASIASGNSAQASGVGSVAMGSGATASADGSVALGQGSSDNGRGAENYTGKYSKAINASAGTVSMGNAATGQTRTVSNVADGQQATDAVNVRQLDGAVAESKQYTDTSIQNVNSTVKNISSAITNVDNRVTQVEGNVSKVQNGTDGMFQVNNTSGAAKPSATGTNSVAGGAGSVASGSNSEAIGTKAKASGANSLAVGNGSSATASNSTALGINSVADRDNSTSVGAVGSERQITNVAAATRGTDAVNFDQLNKSVSNITNNANAYTDQRYSELKRDLKKQDDTLSAGIAGAMAMASLPQPYSPGASMTSIAAANYRGQSALSFGVSRISDNGRWVSKLQATTNTQGDAGIGVGVGYQW
jgi:trimeric autotransporter adhesin